MSTVLLIILLIISIVMTGLILIQHSEGGALGIGGGGGGGGFMSGRSAASSVSRMTWILGTIFLATCLGLSVIMTRAAEAPSILEEAETVETVDKSQENEPSLSNEPLTSGVDSGESTDPLAIAPDADAAETNSDESIEDTAEQPAETPDDE